jgi:hypothetical protein
MRKLSFVLLSLGLVFFACKKESNVSTAVNTPHSSPNQIKTHGITKEEARLVPDYSNTISSFISTAEANVMINSYLASINSSANDTDIRSFSINADTLRAYLADTTVTHLKLMFAHTQNYANSGNYGVHAGYQSGAITIVIAAYNTGTGHYVYHNGNVMDHCVPCPYTCPSGTAGNSTLQ